MKILIAGSFKENSLESYYLKHLHQYAPIISVFASLDLFHQKYHQSLFHKIGHRLKIVDYLQKINEALLDQIRGFQPSIVWVFRGIEILPTTLKIIREMGIPLVNLNPDHPFIYTRGSGNAHVNQSVGLYDLHFCYNKQLAEYIRQNFDIKTISLPFGYNLTEKDFECIQTKKECIRACFIGTADAARKKMIAQLAKAGIPIDVYGKGWNYFSYFDKNIRRFPPVFGRTYWQKLHQYRLQLNLFRPHNNDSHNMRTFEIPAAGGIQLAPNSKDHRQFYQNNQEIFLYNNKNEILKLAKKILNMPTIEADAIRKAARERCLNSGYSYAERTKIVWEGLKQF